MRKSLQLSDFVKSVPRGMIWIAQIAVFAFSADSAFLLRFDFRVPQAYLPDLYFALGIWIVTKIVVFRLAKLDRGAWRYVSVADLVRVVYGNLVASFVGGIFIVLVLPANFPRSIFLLDLMVCFLATSGLRFFVRIFLEGSV